MDTDMDDVTLAFYNNTYWLVVGERHIHTILEGTEKLEFNVNFVTCNSWGMVIELWEKPVGQMPWAIHPKIVARLKAQVERGGDPLGDDGGGGDEGWELNKK